MTDHFKRPSPLSAGFAIILITALIAVILAAAFDLVDRITAKRLACIVFGLMLFGAGNILPKLVMPIGAGSAGAGDRFAGAVFVLAGLACVAIALFAPGDQILLIESVVGISAFALAGLNWLLAARRTPSSDVMPGGSRAASLAKARRMTVILILNGLFWTFLIFVADTMWGDAGARWTLVPFIIVNSLLALSQLKFFRDARG